MVLPFRTAKEAIILANNSTYGLGASVWSENIGLAMEVAGGIKAGSVWINNHNVFDAATGFGGYKESGFGRDGGKEVIHYLLTNNISFTFCWVQDVYCFCFRKPSNLSIEV